MRFSPGLVKRPLASALALATAVAVLGAAGCGGGQGPEIDPVADQVAQVGVELRVQINATDPNGDNVDYGFASEIPDLDSRATIARGPAGDGVFRWTPLASDVGVWYVDFSATDGGATTTTTVRIDVRSAVGAASAPVFVQPLGTGTTLDVTAHACVDLDVVVDDQDSASVEIAQEEPVIDGATLERNGGLAAVWHWCPTAGQIAADDRYTLTLSADDGDNPRTRKNYLVVLRRPGRQDCPGTAPQVSHTPADASTVVGLTVDATITDDLGLKRPPLFYYATTPPSSPPDLATMTQLSMLLIDGDMRSGVWAADVPNPVASMPAGSSAALYYVIVADDDDDPMGSCDHTTQAPASGTYQMTVTNPGGTGDTALCDACTADVQCQGGALCARVGASGDAYCLEGCSGGDCPSGYSCSADPVTSVDGHSARQCVPDTGSCIATVTCVDDDWEDNDSRAEVAGWYYGIDPGTLSATSCPMAGGAGDDDEDWYPIDVSGDTQVTLTLHGASTTDLDLGLYDDAGTLITSSTTLSSSESVTACLGAGRYYVRVYAWGQGQNDYTLDDAATQTSCASSCEDDDQEDDDDALHARSTSYPTTTYDTNAICPDDDDWYAVDVYDGDHLVVDLTFDQQREAEDLDLHLYDDGLTDLTPCSPADPGSCTSAHGQSATSNEHLEWDVTSGCPSGCTYYVVVRGWDGASNLYDFALEIQ
jgi:Bacterial pre-peptidase C-terminal domain